MQFRTAIAITLPVVAAAFGALIGILAAGQLESLPISDNESMTAQLNHLGKQAAFTAIGGLAGAALGGIAAVVLWRATK